MLSAGVRCSTAGKQCASAEMPCGIFLKPCGTYQSALCYFRKPCAKTFGERCAFQGLPEGVISPNAAKSASLVTNVPCRPLCRGYFHQTILNNCRPPPTAHRPLPPTAAHPPPTASTHTPSTSSPPPPVPSVWGWLRRGVRCRKSDGAKSPQFCNSQETQELSFQISCRKF